MLYQDFAHRKNRQIKSPLPAHLKQNMRAFSNVFGAAKQVSYEISIAVVHSLLHNADSQREVERGGV